MSLSELSNQKARHFTALSSDDFPAADQVGVGSTVTQTDTGVTFEFNGIVWMPSKVNGATVVTNSGRNVTGKSAKGRTAAGVGTTPVEVTWSAGDDIQLVTITASFTPGVTSGPQYGLAVFDASSAQAIALMGNSGGVPDSPDTTKNVFMIPLNEPISRRFNTPLSYNDTGNLWLRSVDGTNTLDFVIEAS